MSGAEQYDIFISYAPEDGDIARRLAAELASHGWLVFWNRALLPDTTWRTQIKAALKTAKVVLVVWSDKSMGSRWVEAEADSAFKRDVYIPARIDDCTLPRGLSHVQVSDLRAWNGSPDHALPEVLIHALARRLRSSVMGEPTYAAVSRPRPRLIAVDDDRATALAANQLVRLSGSAVGGDHYEVAVYLSQLRAKPAGMVIGRVGSQCDLVVPHASVSRRHALLRVSDGRLLLSDLGSTNGTLVDSRPASSGGIELTRGSVVRMGDVELTVQGTTH